MKRIWTDAVGDQRCIKTITLKDKSRAQCGKRKAPGADYCKQHVEWLKKHAQQ